ncbi:hypothetical protein CYMTET_25724 [Cymbomonas tetramitiformis]|uniref:Uncharacterized protein n=1 Tax=Cymbomonas tetramitiformis TaxID=36881 RepID=A0AAE0FTZ3_9CHLO|nr:hypothetical protein CYMTET_25724 [Cymbomonas tetramitiformis]
MLTYNNVAVWQTAGLLRQESGEVRQWMTAPPKGHRNASWISVSTLTLPGAQVAADHLCILWCNQVARVMAGALLDIAAAEVRLAEAGGSPASAEHRLEILKRRLLPREVKGSSSAAVATAAQAGGTGAVLEAEVPLACKKSALTNEMLTRVLKQEIAPDQLVATPTGSQGPLHWWWDVSRELRQSDFTWVLVSTVPPCSGFALSGVIPQSLHLTELSERVRMVHGMPFCWPNGTVDAGGGSTRWVMRLGASELTAFSALVLALTEQGRREALAAGGRHSPVLWVQRIVGAGGGDSSQALPRRALSRALIPPWRGATTTTIPQGHPLLLEGDVVFEASATWPWIPPVPFELRISGDAQHPACATTIVVLQACDGDAPDGSQAPEPYGAGTSSVHRIPLQPGAIPAASALVSSCLSALLPP